MRLKAKQVLEVCDARGHALLRVQLSRLGDWSNVQHIATHRGFCRDRSERDEILDTARTNALEAIAKAEGKA